MPLNTAIHSALQSPSAALGFWLTLPSAGAAKTILRSTSSFQPGGFSWVLIDAEHGLISDRDYYELTNAIASEGASPFIRVPWSDEWMIKRALDAGAHGIVTPMCHSEEDAARIVKFSKYPPLGTRGYGPMFASHTFRDMSGSDYDDGANDELIVVVQIESKSGVESVEKIANVDGVDVLFIGPFDLAKQMGVVRGGQEHEEAIRRILKAAHSANKKAAIFCTDGVDARIRVGQGFDLVSVTTDVGVLADGMARELRMVRDGSASKDGISRDSY